jgi:uncharacterized membrane protein
VTTARARLPPTTLVWLLFAASVPIGLYAFVFHFSAPVGDPAFKARFAELPLFAAFHVLGGGIALTIGALQFNASLRAHRPALHRWLGRVYLIAVLIGASGGLALAPYADGGLVARCGFGLLAVLWLISGSAAYRAIRRGDVSHHRQWMMRNFALTFAAVTLRIYMGLLIGGFGFDFAAAYATVAWISWVPNLLLVEWWLLPGRDTQEHERVRTD